MLKASLSDGMSELVHLVALNKFLGGEQEYYWAKGEVTIGRQRQAQGETLGEKEEQAF
jgi:hypothetical protein